MLVFDQLKKSDPTLRLITVLVFAGLTGLFCALWFIQVLSADRYRETEKSQSFRTVRMPAQRGKIYDRNGAVLVENRPSFNVNLYLNALRPTFQSNYLGTISALNKERRESKRPVLKPSEKGKIGEQLRYLAVSNYLVDLSPTLGVPLSMTAKKFHDHFKFNTSLPISVAPNLNVQQMARFLERPDRPPGFDLEIQPLRHYPHGNTGAHVLGHLRKDLSADEENEGFYNYRLPDFRGAVGIEGRYHEYLKGTPGMKSVMVNYLGYSQSETVFPLQETGQNLVLTLDLELQKATEKALASAHAGVQGAAIVMDANNGDIYAMVSLPSFDPNAWTGRISPELWAELSNTNNTPMINRATQAIYAPGSIFKIVSGLAALDVGVVEPGAKIRTEKLFYAKKGGRPMRDLAEPGEYDFVRAFKKSSNFYFATNALLPGVMNKIVRLGAQLHLGEKIGLFPTQEYAGDFPRMEDMKRYGWDPGDTANVSIGQGRIAVTPLHMAIMTAAIANGGTVLWPRIVERIEPKDARFDSAIHFPAGRIRNRLDVKERSLQQVHKAMLADVADRDEPGTGAGAFVEGMEVCGKTGTAQIMERGVQVDKTTWFVSFAPYSRPRYVVVVMVESGGSGGGTCAPVARKIYEHLKMREAKSRSPQIAHNSGGQHSP